MSRNVVGIAVAFALLVGGAMLASDSSVLAGHGCGGGGHHGCGGGLFSRLHRGNGCAGAAVQQGCGGGLFSRLHSRRQASCCAPEPTCCAPEPVCCAPEPACCAPEPACCAPAMAVEPACGTEGVYGGSVVDGHHAVEGEAHSPSDDAPVAPQADGASDVPPAPQPEL
jgi:hypothetical protein